MSNSPNWIRPDVAELAPQLERLADFFAGTDAVRARATVYTPQLDRESDHYWRIRSRGVAAPGHLTRTVEASVGRVFSVAPTLDASGDAEIEADWEDLDGMGTHGDVFLARAQSYAILDGFYLVLVDAPVAPPGGRVPRPDAGKYRPRWIGYRRKQLRNWRTEVVDGRVRVTLVVLDETEDVAEGEFGLAPREVRRVLRADGPTITVARYAQTRDAAGAGGESWTLLEGPFVYDGPREIPLAVLAGGKLVAPFTARPPLLPLCDKLIEFYQVAADMRHYERFSCFPQPTIRGQLVTATGDGKLTLGPTSVVHTEADGAFAWAELEGKSMSELRENQRERLREIGALGLSFLVTETRSAETARAKALDAWAENATLADAARGCEDGANLALQFHASYRKRAAEQAATVSLNKNLSGEVLDAALVRVLLDMRSANELTFAEFREILARGRIIPAEMADEENTLEAELALALARSDVDRDAASREDRDEDLEDDAPDPAAAG
jgi:hypothetical protein